MSSIIYSYTNFAYVELAELWASYIQRLNLNFIIFCVDKESYDYLLSKNIKCNLTEDLLGNGYDFTELGLVRFKLMIHLLKTHKNVTYSDTDAFWFKNPLTELNNNLYDLNLSTVVHKRAYPKNIRKKWGATVCTGWMNFKSSSAELIRDFIKNYYSFNGNDQGKFNNFLFSINEDIHTEINDHYFELNLKKYNLKALALNQSIVKREATDIDCFVDHPVIGTHGGIKRKIKKLKKIYK